MDQRAARAGASGRKVEGGAPAWMAAVLLLACSSTPGSAVSDARLPVPIDGAPARGASAAWVTLVEFTDFQCPFCGNVEPVLHRLLEAYPDDVKLVVRNFPLSSIHRYAQGAAVAAQCAYEQDLAKYWAYHDRLFAQQAALAESDLEQAAADVGLDVNAWRACVQGGDGAAQVAADVQLGAQFGVSGTPTFFVNGRELVGAYPYEDFRSLVDSELAAAKASGIPVADYYDRAVLHR